MSSATVASVRMDSMKAITGDNMFQLTSVDEGVDVFDLPDRRMVAVRHQGLDCIQEAVHIYNRPGIRQGMS